MTARFNTLVTSALLVVSFGFATPSYAVKVVKTKGKKVLVDGEGDSLEVGQIFLVKNDAGKSVGIIKLTKVARGKAVAILGKGVAEAGQNLVPKKTKSGETAPPEPMKEAKTRGKKPSADQAYWGAMVGYTMAKADINLFDGTGAAAGSVALDGSGFSAKALYDYPLFSAISFRGMAGMEQFNVGGASSAACSSSGAVTECKAEIMYLTIDFWGRYMFSRDGTFRPWAGLGGWLIFPMTKDSTAIKESSIDNSNIFAIGGGFDYYLSETTYLPVQIEYQMYPKSENVNATAIAIRGGYAIPW